MSDMYAIKTSTLTALGDAVRSKVGTTRTEIVDNVYVYEGTFTSITSETIVYLQLNEQYDSIGVKLVECVGSLPEFDISGNTSETDVIIEVGEEHIYTGDIPIRNGKYSVMVRGSLQPAHYNEPCDYRVEITPYMNGVALTKEIEVPNTMTPLEMAEEINNMPAGPTDEDLYFTGSCLYVFTKAWGWAVEKYGDKIITKDITDATSMFNTYPLKTVPFEINCKSSSSMNMANMFNAAKIEIAPKINNAKVDSLQTIFGSCWYLREVPMDFCETWDWSYANNTTSAYIGNQSGIFSNCYSLRSFPMSLLENGNPAVSYSYSVFRDTFQNNFALDEIIDMPNPHYNGTYTGSSYSGLISSSFLSYCSRLKNFTFREMNPVNWANQTLDLAQYVGWSISADRITAYSGIGTDKQVKDDATYQALKDDPDWWTTDVAYSRYNHDSAVRTINSLPSAIEYQTANSQKANIVKFKGAAGSATDGGAINTLTEAEIAVATAKGWTVTLA